MKWNGKCKIEMACGAKSLRAGLRHAQLVKMSKKSGDFALAASDGRILAFAPVEVAEDEKPTSGFIPHMALKLAKPKRTTRKTRTTYASEHVLEIGKNAVTVDNGITVSRNIESTRPDVVHVWRHAQKVHEQAVKKCTLLLNPTLLARLAKALGAEDGVSMDVILTDGGACASTHPIIVRPIEHRDAFGLLMPIKPNGSK